MDNRTIIQKSLDYIEENLQTEITAAELAEMAGFSLFHYYRLFQQATGLPVMQYILRRRLLHRVFADAKEQHGMRYPRFRGLAPVRNWVKFQFAAMNLIKYANRFWKDTRPRCVTYVLSLFLPEYTVNPCFA